MKAPKSRNVPKTVVGHYAPIRIGVEDFDIKPSHMFYTYMQAYSKLGIAFLHEYFCLSVTPHCKLVPYFAIVTSFKSTHASKISHSKFDISR